MSRSARGPGTARIVGVRAYCFPIELPAALSPVSTGSGQAIISETVWQPTIQSGRHSVNRKTGNLLRLFCPETQRGYAVHLGSGNAHENPIFTKDLFEPAPK